MKKIKTFALMLLTAFAFSSCVDVPSPFNLPDKGSNSGGGGSSVVEGTPVTCAEAVELTNALADGATSSELYTITGYITQVVGDVSRNQQTFWMADTKDGGKVFEAFWANLPDGITEFKAGMKVKITGKLMKYVNANSGSVIPEIKNATVEILEDDGGGGSTIEEGIQVSCQEAADLANALADGATSAETYTITGYITEIVGSVSRNQQSFWMADIPEGGRVFEAYYANLPEGVSVFTKGMKVKVTGTLTKYINSSTGMIFLETKNPTVVILEQGGGEQPVGDVIPVTCDEAVQLTTALADNTTSTDTYAVTGYITDTDGNVSTKTGPRQQVFWMADDLQGGKVFEAYWANVPDGVDAFTVGMKVTLTGKLKKYVNNKGEVTCEIQNGTVVILEQGDGGQGGGDEPGPTPGPGGDEVTDLVNGGFEEWVSESEPLGWKSASTASNATLSQSQDAHDGMYACLIGAPGTANKRLATQEMTLEAGSYTFSFYAKASTPQASQTRVGFVPIKDDGSVGTYTYKDAAGNDEYIDLNNNGWTLVTYEFTLTETTKLCLIVMNPKNSSYSVSQDILVDDATLTKK